MLVTYVWRLLHSWWRSDRIRVSPAEGRLLRLAPPCVLIIAGQPVEVKRRTVRDTRREQLVIYVCQSRNTEGQLIVQRMRPRGARIFWQHDGTVRRLQEADLDVYPAR